MKKTKKIKQKMSKNIKLTILGMLLIILFMALVFNFSIDLKYSHEKDASANVILWPIEQFMELLFYKWIGMGIDNKWALVLSFFFTEVPYIFILITMFGYAFNFARGFSTDKEISDWISSKNGFSGRIVGAIMGFVSPFCSCSTIPVMTTLAKTRAPFGTIVAFLITSPMINETGLALMVAMFGYKIALIYIAFGLVIGIAGSYFAKLFKLEDSFKIDINKGTIIEHSKFKRVVTFKSLHKKAWKETKEIVKNIWWMMIIALAIGSVMHGWIPEDWIKK